MGKGKATRRRLQNALKANQGNLAKAQVRAGRVEECVVARGGAAMCVELELFSLSLSTRRERVLLEKHIADTTLHLALGARKAA